jgi:hypothetical protein
MSSSRESRLETQGNPKLQFARKSTSQFLANPIAGIPAISIANQSLQDISRTTKKGFSNRLACKN